MQIEIDYIDYCCTKPGWYWYRTDLPEPDIHTKGPWPTLAECIADAEYWAQQPEYWASKAYLPSKGD